ERSRVWRSPPRSRKPSWRHGRRGEPSERPRQVSTAATHEAYRSRQLGAYGP
ncbi:unnamed protein product, partial [Ectocarpus sp. 13 AM-2016]